jgi:hypothetical protein
LSSSDLDLYEGRVVVVRLDPDRLEDINSFLEPYVNDLKPGERIHTSIKGDVLTVRILKKKS